MVLGRGDKAHLDIVGKENGTDIKVTVGDEKCVLKIRNDETGEGKTIREVGTERACEKAREIYKKRK